MDRPITTPQSRWRSWRWGLVTISLLAAAAGLYYLLPAGNAIAIPREQITIGEVISGKFEDYVPIRGVLSPAATYFIDSPEAGTVEDIAVEDGATLRAGQLILRIANTDLRLNILARESEHVQQISNMDSLRLQAEQIDLDNSRQLAEAEWQSRKAQRAVTQSAALASVGFVSAENAKAVQEEADYWRDKRDLALRAQMRHRQVHAQYMAHLKQANDQLSRSLQVAKKAEDNLIVRAPRDGTLTAFSVQKGQFLQRGARIAQIDDANDFVVSAEVDEFHLPRVAVGMRSVAEIDGATYELRVAKIFPQVKDHQFRIELSFTAAPQRMFRRGQAVNARLVVGNSVNATMAPVGPYLQETGGNWAFVVDSGKSRAGKQMIEIGRRNEKYVEITAGLKVGDKIVISSYTPFRRNDVILIGSD